MHTGKPLPRTNLPAALKRAAKEPIWGLLLVYVIIRLFYLDTVQRWDGAWYFCRLLESVRGFDFTLGNFINNFNWFGHPSMGYALIMSPGQFIDPGNHYLLNAQLLLLAVVAVFSFYKILVYLYRQNKGEVLLVTALLAFNPLFFGVSLSFNTDFPLAVFWLALVCAVLYRRFIPAALFGLLLVFSKETGALIYFAFLLALLLIFAAGKVFPGQRLYLLQGRGVTAAAWLVLPFVMFMSYLFYRRGKLWGGGSLGWDNNGFHTFGFNWASFKGCCLEIFLLNFSWILVAIILVYLLHRLLAPFSPARKRLAPWHGPRRDVLLVNLFVFVVLVVFNLFFITFNHPRYVLPAVVLLLFFAYHALAGLVKNKTFRVAVLSLLLVLFAAQTFRTIDPLSKLAFGTRDFGEHKVLAINPGDGMVYNAEYTVIDRLLNKFNQEIGINENTCVILSDDGWNAHFNGAEHHTTINIDRYSLKRTFKSENSFRPRTFSVWEISGDNRPPGPCYLYLSWFGDEAADLAHLQQYYRVTETRRIEHRGYFFKLYQLE